jgi:hypothetical protein
MDMGGGMDEDEGAESGGGVGEEASAREKVRGVREGREQVLAIVDACTRAVEKSD